MYRTGDTERMLSECKTKKMQSNDKQTRTEQKSRPNA